MHRFCSSLWLVWVLLSAQVLLPFFHVSCQISGDHSVSNSCCDQDCTPESESDSKPHNAATCAICHFLVMPTRVVDGAIDCLGKPLEQICAVAIVRAPSVAERVRATARAPPLNM